MARARSKLKDYKKAFDPMRNRTLFLILIAIVVMTLAAGVVKDPDFWWHLRTGQLIFDTGTIPKADMFSFSVNGKEWITHEWLSELLIFVVFKAGGFAALIFVFALIVCATFQVSYLVAMRRGGDVFVSGAIVLLGTVATMPVWGIRPQIISMLLTSVFIAVLFDYVRRRSANKLWPLPLLMLLWANLHASFALGIALTGLTVVAIVIEELWEGTFSRETIRQCLPILLVLVASIGLALLNPSGYRLLTYPFETLASPMMQTHIEEWFSPDFHQVRFIPLMVLIVVCIVVLAVSPGRRRVSDLVIFCAGLVAALRSGRHVPVFALIAIPIIAEHATVILISRKPGLFGKEDTSVPVGNAIVLRICLIFVALLLFGVHFKKVTAQQPMAETRIYPKAAIEFLAGEHSLDRIFNCYDWGGYFIWRLYPERLVFIDGRADVYGDTLFEEYFNTSNGQPNWRETLNKYQINAALIKPDSALASLLRVDPDWRKVYEDKQAVVFARGR